MAYVDFINRVHKSTKRNYQERVCVHDKAACAEVAIKFDKDYWDGDRMHGYGGFRYDGRWKPIAEDMVKHYNLTASSSVLDVGCGKGFLLHEFQNVLPGVTVAGLDISQYAIDNSKEEVRPFLTQGSADRLPYPDKSFDFVYSILTLHNLYLPALWKAVQEVERVSRGGKYIVVEAYRNEQEKVNLLYWQLTCRAFHTPEEWEWLFEQAGYRGDHSFIYFE